MRLFAHKKNPRTGQPRSATYGRDIELPRESKSPRKSVLGQLGEAAKGVRTLQEKGLIKGRKMTGGKR